MKLHNRLALLASQHVGAVHAALAWVHKRAAWPSRAKNADIAALAAQGVGGAAGRAVASYHVIADLATGDGSAVAADLTRVHELARRQSAARALQARLANGGGRRTRRCPRPLPQRRSRPAVHTNGAKYRAWRDASDRRAAVSMASFATVRVVIAARVIIAGVTTASRSGGGAANALQPLHGRVRGSEPSCASLQLRLCNFNDRLNSGAPLAGVPEHAVAAATENAEEARPPAIDSDAGPPGLRVPSEDVLAHAASHNINAVAAQLAWVHERAVRHRTGCAVVARLAEGAHTRSPQAAADTSRGASSSRSCPCS